MVDSHSTTRALPAPQDIAGTLESALAAPALELQPPAAAGGGPGGAGEPAFALAPTAAAWRGLQRCLEADVFLSQLGDKFVRLAMQLLARYATWVQQGMAQRAQRAAEAGAAAAAAPAAGQPGAEAEQAQPKVSGLFGGRRGAPGV